MSVWDFDGGIAAISSSMKQRKKMGSEISPPNQPKDLAPS